MSHYHAVVWIDHEQAHVMHISPDDVEKSIVQPAKPHQHLHAHAGTLGSGRPRKTKPTITRWWKPLRARGKFWWSARRRPSCS